MDQEIKNILKQKQDSSEAHILTTTEQNEVWEKLESKLGATRARKRGWWRVAAAACIGMLAGIAAMKLWMGPATRIEYVVKENNNNTISHTSPGKGNTSIPQPPTTVHAPAVAATHKAYSQTRLDTIHTVAYKKPQNKPTIQEKTIPTQQPEEAGINDSAGQQRVAVNTVHLLDINDADISPLVPQGKKQHVYIPTAFFDNPAGENNRYDDEQPSIIRNFYKKFAR